MDDAVRRIHEPLGQPGSGRVRYGAAMALYQAGQISAEVLEVYRVAAAHDGRDPSQILREWGLPVPEITMTDSPLSRLYTAARD